MNIVIITNSSKDGVSIKETIKEISNENIVDSFSDEKEAQDFIKNNHVDVAFIDYEFIEIARKLKKKNSQVNLIFMNKNKSYSEDALELKASAYLFKPVKPKQIKDELKSLRYPVNEDSVLLRVQCFGNFSVFDGDGRIVKFSRSKSKEILAYLVYKCGSDVSTKELCATLFEDEAYDNKHLVYLHQILHTLLNDLKAIHAEDVLVRRYNSTSINISKIDCDYYRFNSNDELAKRMYNGEFMMQYEWADYVTGYLDRNLN